MNKNKFDYSNKLIKALILFFFIIIVTCNYHGKHEEINLFRNDKVSVFDVFSDIFIVPLETTNESFISSISQVLYHNEKYYILDRKLQAIFCFDVEGRFQYKISRQGKGPGEYLIIQHISISESNEVLYLLDPPAGKIHCYNLEGSFIETLNINEIYGYYRICPLDENTLLLLSSTGYEVHRYSISDQRIIQQEFKLPTFSIGRFNTSINGAYQYGERTYFLPALERVIYDVTESEPKKHFQWSFGQLNNSARQLNRLIEALENRQRGEQIFLNDAVSDQRLLNYHIFSIYENARFKIAILEFDNDYKHLFLNKPDNEILVFTNFKEGIALHGVDFCGDYIITWNRHFDLSKADRNLSQYKREIFPKTEQLKIENHNLVTDNPYLVVYKLKN